MSTRPIYLPARIDSKEADTSPISTSLVCGLLRIADLCAIGASGAAAYWIWVAGEPSLHWMTYVLVAMLGALLAINAFHIAGGYSWETVCSISDSLRRTLFAWAGVLALLLVIAFATKTSDQFSRAWLMLWFSFSTVLLATARIVFYLAILDWKSQGRLRRNVVVFGVGQIGQRLISEIASKSQPEVRILAAFDDRLQRSPHYCWEIPVMGDLEALIEFTRDHPVDSVIVALPPSAEERLLEIFDRLSTLPVDVRLCTGTVGFRLGPVGVSHLCNVPLLNVIDRPLSGWRHTVKSMEDHILASLILVMIAPLMLLIAIAIKLDSPGPVFFRQKRYGFNNQLIEVFKFRTMYDDKRDENAEQLTRRNDPRVTPLGAFLRRSSLDELPQFFNVLRGEMSIVGPRPHACAAKAAGVLYQDAVQRYAARHRVKPGITGWAQINGWRGETETLEQIEQRVRHDLMYIENWSLALDLKIILVTAFAGFTGRRAY